MPLYEYECDVCSHRFEVIQRFSDAPIAVCPQCGGAVHKLPSSPAIQFKGSGFYITDYARSGKSESGKSDSGDASAGKSDSGTAEKGDSASSSAAKGESGGASGSDRGAAPKGDAKPDGKKPDSKPSASTKPD